MTRVKALTLASFVALGGMFAGCKSGSSTPPDSTPPAVTPATQPSMVMPNQGKPPEPPTTLEKPATSSMTHMLTKDEPFFPSMPGADAKSLGMVKSGTKCLVLIPGDTYSKVLTEDGATVYVGTEGLEPLPAKK
jgi:hypothetical protein